MGKNFIWHIKRLAEETKAHGLSAGIGKTCQYLLYKVASPFSETNRKWAWYLYFFLEKMIQEGFGQACGKACRKLWRFLVKKVLGERNTALLPLLSPVPRKARSLAKQLTKDCSNPPSSMQGKYQIIRGAQEDFSSLHAVLLSHQDPEQIVDPYVQYMARHFKAAEKKVILCSSRPLKAMPEDPDCFDAIVCCTHSGFSSRYDWTNWKTGLEAFPSLYEAKELTLCSDSVFAPTSSYVPVYHAMHNVPCDFWGMTVAKSPVPHMAGGHLVLRGKVLQHPALKQFFASVPATAEGEATPWDGRHLGLWLELHRLQPGVLRSYPRLSDPMLHWERILQDGIPILQRDLLQTGGRLVPLPEWAQPHILAQYPYKLILNYFYRLGLDISSALCPGERSASYPPSVFLRQKAIDLSGEYQEGHDEGAHPRVAAFIHCYYTDIMSECMLKYIKNLPKYCHIYISTDTDEKVAALDKIVSSLDFEKIEIRKLPNKGWDIGPFLVGFRDCLSQYDIICKIHAKASTHNCADFVRNWRDMLYEPLLGTQEHVRKILRLLVADKELGLLAPPTFPFLTVAMGSNTDGVRALAQKMGIDLPQNEAIDFPVGSMFWARPAALQPLLDLDLSFDDFDITDTRMRDATLPHALERVVALCCCQAGYSWGRVPPPPYERLAPPLHWTAAGAPVQSQS